MEVTRPRGQRHLKVLLFSTSVILTLILSEIGLEIAMRFRPKREYCFWPPGMNAVFKPRPELMPGISGESHFITNAQGIRGDEIQPEAKHRILAIGASTTECSLLDQTETWTSLLQQALNKEPEEGSYWVGNGGVSGLTSRHHLVTLDVLPLNELQVETVCVLMGVNDLTLRLSHEKDFAPTYMDKPEAKRELLAQTFSGSFDIYPEDPFFKRTALWQMLRRSKKVLARNNAQDAEGRIYATWRENRQRASEIRNEMPDLSSALEEYARNLERMIDLAKKKSVRIIFMTQPYIWKSGLAPETEALLWLGGIGDFQNVRGSVYYSAPALEKGMRAYNETMIRVCQARGVECLDLAAALGQDPRLFYDDVHFNEEGARKVARVLYQFINKEQPAR